MTGILNSAYDNRRWGTTTPLHGASGDTMNWLEEVPDRVLLALVWLVAAAIGFLIYFVPIAPLLGNLAE